MGWIPVVVLPNIETPQPVGNESVVICSAIDTMLEDFRRNTPNFEEFTSRFSSAFGNLVKPSIIAFWSEERFAQFDLDALLDFGDVFVCLS
mgnify:CR=1 FL=1